MQSESKENWERGYHRDRIGGEGEARGDGSAAIKENGEIYAKYRLICIDLLGK